MKIKVACFTAILLLVRDAAVARAADDAADDAATSVADAQLDVESDVISLDDGSPASDVDDAEAEVDAGSTSEGGTVSDAGAGGLSGPIDGGSPEGGPDAADAGPPPPPITQFYDQSPGCSLGGAPDAGVGALVESALVGVLLLRRRRARQ